MNENFEKIQQYIPLPSIYNLLPNEKNDIEKK